MVFTDNDILQFLVYAIGMGLIFGLIYALLTGSFLKK